MTAERKRSTPFNPAFTLRKTTVTKRFAQWPYRERVIHLLALKPHKKPEMLARLESNGVNKKDKNSLGVILQRVANFNPKDNSYTLKDSVYKEIQRDWPGYLEADKLLLDRVLSIKINQSQKVGSNQIDSTLSCGATASPGQKHLLDSGLTDPLMTKKRRISYFTNCELALNDHLGEKPGPSAAAAPGLSPLPSSHLPGSNLQNMNSICTSPPSNSTSPESWETQDLSNEEACTISEPSSPTELPNYMVKYTVIVSNEQRQSYNQDFNSEYDEYRYLHAKIGNINKRFKQLDAQRKCLSPGSKEYQLVNEEVLMEYCKFKETNPNYYEEKYRCEYLYEKLAHIKRLIQEFDQ